jgi:hypothetical protein
MVRYRELVRDPSNPVRRVRIIASTPAAADFLGARSEHPRAGHRPAGTSHPAEGTPMGRRMIVIAREPGDFTVSLERFRRSAAQWQPHASLVDGVSDDDPVDAAIQVERPGERFFQIFHFRDGTMLSTDGDDDQAAEVAAWAVNTFPVTGDGELWMVDQGYSGHIVLPPGMSSAEVWPGWRQHE